MTAPLCSVVIPAYNAIDFLPAAIRSVFDQAIDAVEVLVLDDGSTDGTAQWLALASAADSRIRVFQGGRLGPARARNLLIRKAKADLVAFLDADDVWLPGKLAEEIAFHRANPDVGFTFTDYRHVDMAGNLRSTAFEYWKPDYAAEARNGFVRLHDPVAQLFAANVAGTSCVVAKRECLRNAKGFAEELPSAEDWDLWLRLARSHPVAASGKVTMHYLMRPGSETSNRGARIAAMRDLVGRHKRGVAGWAVRAARSRIYSSQAQWSRERRKFLPAAIFAAAALALRPSSRMMREFLGSVRDLARATAGGAA